MDQFQWRQLSTGSLAARILDSFLEGDTIKLNIQVREVSPTNSTLEPSLKTNFTKSHSILFDIVRSLPELTQLDSSSPTLDSLKIISDHDEKLAKAIETATQVLDNLVLKIGQNPLSSEIIEFFKQDYNAVSRIKHDLPSDQSIDTWTSKLIRRISQHSNNLVEPVIMNRSKSDTASESDPIPLLKRSFTVAGRSDSLLRRVTQRMKSSVDEETRPSLMRQPSKLLSRFNSHRETSNTEKSKQRPTISRSLTSYTQSTIKTTPKTRPVHPLVRSGTLRDRLTRKKPELDYSVVEITILLPNQSSSEIKLTVSQDITYVKLVRGLRNKAILSGTSLPTPECLQLYYYRGSISIPLCSENLLDFFTNPEVEKQVAVSVDARLSSVKRVSWLDLNSPSLASPSQFSHARKLSTQYSGLLDLESPAKQPSPVFQLDRLHEMSNIDDYLRTPCKTEVKNIMSDSLWGTMPQLQFSVPSSPASSSNSSPQKSPELSILEGDIFTSEPSSMEEGSLPPSPPPPRRQNTMRSLLSRQSSTLSAIIDGIPSQLAKLKVHNSTRRSPLQTSTVPVRSISNFFPSRLKVTVAINGEFVIKLDLEPRTATYTSLHNRITTKFSRGGYPLAKLNDMSLVYCYLSQPSFAPESTLTIQDTPTLHRIMSLTCQSNQPILHLLMVPNSLLIMDTQVNRKGMRWEAPPNLVKVGQLTQAIKS